FSLLLSFAIEKKEEEATGRDPTGTRPFCDVPFSLVKRNRKIRLKDWAFRSPRRAARGAAPRPRHL
ncbi:hypothetical protein, partial [Anaerotruncus massiliensis (ex Togo et al. 2019)]|uniref:hypothetical protein n=1 Tax=Anaerotruncus massiliensis (ex Togo et al. 2019) TaxID=1673720 RepID=UPI0023EF626D